MWDKTMNVLGLIDKDVKDMILSVWALDSKKFSIALINTGLRIWKKSIRFKTLALILNIKTVF